MKRLILLAAFIATPAIAQQQPSPVEQALGQKLMQEISAGVQCTAQAITLKGEFDKSQEEVKRLTEKYEPKK